MAISNHFYDNTVSYRDYEHEMKIREMQRQQAYEQSRYLSAFNNQEQPQQAPATKVSQPEPSKVLLLLE